MLHCTMFALYAHLRYAYGYAIPLYCLHFIHYVNAILCAYNSYYIVIVRLNNGEGGIPLIYTCTLKGYRSQTTTYLGLI